MQKQIKTVNYWLVDYSFNSKEGYLPAPVEQQGPGISKMLNDRCAAEKRVEKRMKLNPITYLY